MLYREIIAVCSQIHTKHINTLCVQNVELLNVKVSVNIVTSSQCVTFSVYMNTVSNADMISRVSTCPLPPQKKIIFEKNWWNIMKTDVSMTPPKAKPPVALLTSCHQQHNATHMRTCVSGAILYGLNVLLTAEILRGDNNV